MFDPKALDAWLDVLISYEKGDDPCRLSGMGWGVDKGHSDYRPLLFRASQLPFAVKQTVAGLFKKCLGGACVSAYHRSVLGNVCNGSVDKLKSREGDSFLTGI